jgi:hypothetical protein
MATRCGASVRELCMASKKRSRLNEILLRSLSREWALGVGPALRWPTDYQTIINLRVCAEMLEYQSLMSGFPDPDFLP